MDNTDKENNRNVDNPTSSGSALQNKNHQSHPANYSVHTFVPLAKRTRLIDGNGDVYDKDLPTYPNLQACNSPVFFFTIERPDAIIGRALKNP